MNQIIETLKALLTPVIAIITAYIAWQQWKINKQKYNLDLYERRLRIYEEIKKIFKIVGKDTNVAIHDLLDFIIKVSEADFLFGDEIKDFINEIYSHGANLHVYKGQYIDLTQIKPEGYNHEEVCKNIDMEIKWFFDQDKRAKKLFSKYLKLNK